MSRKFPCIIDERGVMMKCISKATLFVLFVAECSMRTGAHEGKHKSWSRKRAFYSAPRSHLIVHDDSQLQKSVCLGIERLERVVLGGNLLDKVVANEGNLLHNILANLGNVGEEEEGKDAGDSAVASSSGSARAMLVDDVERCMSEKGSI
jgi:hypothetical protein